MNNWYVGTIGFSYKDWVGEFYPVGAAQREYLPYYCKVFNAVEIDSTFHSIPQRSIVEGWTSKTPEDFRFCVKTPRLITHEMGLKSAEGIMHEFLEAIAPLKIKAGPILIQLPPSYTQNNLPILAEFLTNLPSTHRYAIEFRHSSWYNEKTSKLLSQNQLCWVSIDYPQLSKQVQPTTDFLYIRWIGENNLYHIHSHERVDRSEELLSWMEIIKPYLRDITTVYGFFNNDYAGCAAATGKRFLNIAGLAAREAKLPRQEKLF